MNHQHRILFTGVLFFFSTAAFAGDRYILDHKDQSKILSAVKNSKGQLVRHMKFSSGAVVELPGADVQELRKQGYQIVEDIELKVVYSEDTLRAKGKPAPPAPSTQSIPWGINAIKAPSAHSISKGLGVKVCIVDTGIDKTHPDLKSNIIGGRNYVFQKGRLDSSAYTDDNGHGTHVAGTIAALDNNIGVVGVAPLASLYAVKVLNRQGSGYLSDVADGVSDCVSVGAKVINMSLGANADPNESSPLRTAVENAIAAGVIVVVAAGNEGQDIKFTVPAGYPGAVAVAAVDSSYQFAGWSNYGLFADDLSAPGVSVTSTWMGGTYNTISGTSMASPHVAGVAALLLSSNSLGFKTVDLGFPLSTQGAGFIDALKTVQNQAGF